MPQEVFEVSEYKSWPRFESVARLYVYFIFHYKFFTYFLLKFQDEILLTSRTILIRPF